MVNYPFRPSICLITYGETQFQRHYRQEKYDSAQLRLSTCLFHLIVSSKVWIYIVHTNTYQVCVSYLSPSFCQEPTRRQFEIHFFPFPTFFRSCCTSSSLVEDMTDCPFQFDQISVITQCHQQRSAQGSIYCQ